ncbi:hypothetical protein [Paenirhodobacter sp. CAU 1674]|uniref:hypothetical protein n=1 Tax=Paenirhodobacter sp. CAU 1674 TaxID=3032596 RepID=UPI0023D9D138|nr:hypothetical protein [Paenirhodobacter sp. CAU 1674]MDF2143178.1 hypothetical protein [Paenirhodobacter sp. CAU 1674]
MNINALFARAAPACLHAFVLFSAVIPAALLMLVLPAAPAAAQAIGYAPRTVIIGNDMGGDVGARANKIAAMRAQGRRVAIVGTACYSSCTMYLGMAGTCISRKTQFGFHKPSFYGADLSPAKFEYWSQIIAQHYPAALQEWYLRAGRYSTNLIRISGAELIRLGVSECDTPSQNAQAATH